MDPVTMLGSNFSPFTLTHHMHPCGIFFTGRLRTTTPPKTAGGGAPRGVGAGNWDRKVGGGEEIAGMQPVSPVPFPSHWALRSLATCTFDAHC